MNKISTHVSGGGEPRTLFIGGAEYCYPHDYLPLTDALNGLGENGTHYIANNPHQAHAVRSPTWEAELIEAYLALCAEKNITEIVGSSRGTLHALMMRERRVFKNIILFHPPLTNAVHDNKRRLKGPSKYGGMDLLLGALSDGISDRDYISFLENHHRAYGSDTKRLLSIVEHDLKGISEAEVRRRIETMEADLHTRYLVFEGGRDPLKYPNLSDKNKTRVNFEDQGHFSQFGNAVEAAEVIVAWRKGEYVPPVKKHNDEELSKLKEDPFPTCF